MNLKGSFPILVLVRAAESSLSWLLVVVLSTGRRICLPPCPSGCLTVVLPLLWPLKDGQFANGHRHVHGDPEVSGSGRA